MGAGRSGIMRKLSTRRARRMARARKTHGGGRPKVPRHCPKCGVACASTRAALGHC